MSRAGLSVVVATYRRPAGLDRLLELLRPQVQPRPERRVIVVNDGGHDEDYARVVARHRDFVDYVAAPENRGPAAARNLGAARADRDFLVFVDDDCEPPPGWLDWLAAVLAENPDVDAVGGTTRPIESPRPGLFETFLAASGYHPQPVEQDGRLLLMVTANMAVRRSLFDALGGFDEAMRTTEDRNLTYRLGRRGAIAYLDLNWYVRHDVRSSPRAHFRRFYHYGLGGSRQLELEEDPPDRSYWPPRARPLGFWPARVAHSFRRAAARADYRRLSPPLRLLYTALSAATLLTLDVGFVRGGKRRAPGPARPLRVAYVSPSSELDGAGRLLLEILRRLDRFRFEPTVVLASEGGLEEAARAEWAEVQRMPWLLETARGGILRTAAAAARFAWWLLRSGIDVVELHGAEKIFPPAPRAAARLAGCALVLRESLPAGRADAARRLRRDYEGLVEGRREESVPGRVLSRRPLIITTPVADGQSLGLADALGAELAERDAVFLLGLNWSHAAMSRCRALAQAISRHRGRHPRHALIVLCNEPLELGALSQLDVPARLLNRNLFVDEGAYRPLDGSCADFTAVHIAGMMPWKRHELSREIASVLHVFDRDSSPSRDRSAARLNRLRRELPSHRFLNGVGEWDFERLPPAEVNRAINSARVGLCLSAVEGAMPASIEYLLAGLPVVSTTSLGGRDQFFDPDYCLVVPPDAREIRDAVDALIARGVPPDYVRRRTLARIELARRQFLDLLRELAPDGGFEPERIPVDFFKEGSLRRPLGDYRLEAGLPDR